MSVRFTFVQVELELVLVFALLVHFNYLIVIQGVDIHILSLQKLRGIVEVRN